jgi:pimeloyl-ACP methyl ester carboxylesterase
LLATLKIPKADVMGYSLGGHVAQAFTVSCPEKVNSLILVASFNQHGNNLSDVSRSHFHKIE